MREELSEGGTGEASGVDGAIVPERYDEAEGAELRAGSQLEGIPLCDMFD